MKLYVVPVCLDMTNIYIQILKPGWQKFPGGRDGSMKEKDFYASNPVVTYHAHKDWVTKAAYVEVLTLYMD